jgi:hypothetical protein
MVDINNLPNTSVKDEGIKGNFLILIQEVDTKIKNPLKRRKKIIHTWT